MALVDWSEQLSKETDGRYEIICVHQDSQKEDGCIVSIYDNTKTRSLDVHLPKNLNREETIKQIKEKLGC